MRFYNILQNFTEFYKVYDFVKFGPKANFWSFGLIFQTPSGGALIGENKKQIIVAKSIILFIFVLILTFLIIFDLWVDFSDPSGGDLIGENEIS